MITRSPRSRHLHIAFGGFVFKKFTKPVHESNPQVPPRASHAATPPNKPVNAMLEFDQKINFLTL